MKRHSLKHHGPVFLGIQLHEGICHVARIAEDVTKALVLEIPEDQLLSWVERQLPTASAVYSSYEAGPLECTLHRELTARGVRNLLLRRHSGDTSDPVSRACDLVKHLVEHVENSPPTVRESSAPVVPLPRLLDLRACIIGVQ